MDIDISTEVGIYAGFYDVLVMTIMIYTFFLHFPIVMTMSVVKVNH